MDAKRRLAQTGRALTYDLIRRANCESCVLPNRGLLPFGDRGPRTFTKGRYGVTRYARLWPNPAVA